MRSCWLPVLLTTFLGAGCTSSPGQIDVTLNLDGTVVQANIQDFIFITFDPTPGSTAPKILYPSDCVGCNDGAAECDPSLACLKKDTTCGFATTQRTWTPQLDFAEYPAKSTITLVACALDANQAPVGYGSTASIPNQNGTSVTIAMTASATCAEAPALCP
ncbi:MAG: hypothetical protein V1495_08095 [Pseudomonadota bacterium]